MRARSITRVARSPVLQSQATANFPGPSGRATSFQPVPWQNWQFSSGIVERAYGRARRTARVGRCGILCKKKINTERAKAKRRKAHRGKKRHNRERRRVYREENAAERIPSAGGGCGWGQSRGARVFLARHCWLRERVLAGLHWRIRTFVFPFPAFFRACLG